MIGATCNCISALLYTTYYYASVFSFQAHTFE